MKRLPLVSIITPCYNGAKVISRMMESVIAQTYGNIEYILVNDGSTDETEKVVLPLGEKMKAKGYRFIYVKQENGGLGAAINAGLRVFSGDYLCWADADDFYAPESVEKRVLWLEEHPDYGVVTSDAYIVNEDDLHNQSRRVSQGITDNENENQFWNMLDGNSIFCCACHMVRTSDFLKANPNREIYPARRGQNWQMLLPVYYHCKRYFMREPLFYCVVMSESMSKDNCAKDFLVRADEHEDILLHVVNGIEMTTADRERAIARIKENYCRRRLYIAFYAGLGDVADAQVKQLRTANNLTLRDRLYQFGAKHRRFRILITR